MQKRSNEIGGYYFVPRQISRRIEREIEIEIIRFCYFYRICRFSMSKFKTQRTNNAPLAYYHHNSREMNTNLAGLACVDGKQPEK